MRTNFRPWLWIGSLLADKVTLHQDHVTALGSYFYNAPSNRMISSVGDVARVREVIHRYHSSRVRRGALSTLLADRHLVLYQLGHSPTQNIKLFPQIVQPSVFRLELKQIYSIREINTVTGHD